jgi:uncharacterized repeat protein (TIGR01451 family)
MKKLGVFLLCATFSTFLTAVTVAAQTPVTLGTADSYAVLAGSTITNTGSSVVTGDLGLSPGTAVTGSPTVSGTIRTAGAAATAKDALVTAYDDAAGRGPVTTVATELGGQTLVPGVYNSAAGTFGITGILTLNGGANAVFIFKAASTLITAAGAPGTPASQVVLIGGAQPCNVFWQVGSSATLGTYSVFQGSIMALESITATTGATVNGRLLARNGAVTLDTNTITRSACAGSPPPPPPVTLACPANAGQVLVAYSSAAVAGGGTPPYTFSVASGALPAGLSLNTTTGAITGTPTTAGPFSFTASVTDSLGATATSSSCGITIAPPPPPPPSLACPASTGLVGTGYSSALVVTGGTGPYTFSISSGSLPSGLALNTSSGAITGTPTTAGPFSFTARVTDSLGATATSSSCGITIAPVADLTITKSHLGNFQQGSAGSYALTASNTGLGATSGTVTVSDTLPTGLTATAISGTGWTCTLASRTCTRSDVLAAGASYAPITVTVNVAGNAPATVINTTTVSGGGEVNVSNNSASDTTTIIPPEEDTNVPDLTISKSHSGNFVQGQIGATYMLTASNAGLDVTRGTVTVSDTLPAGLTATAISGTGWTCTLASLSCTRRDVLAAGASYAPITVTVNVADHAPANVINTTTVSGGGELNTGNNSAADSTTITQQAPDLTITKSHPGNFQQGGTGAYTLTVTNIGPGPTSGTVTVSDTLPAGLTATAISGTGWTCTLASRTCTRSDSLAAGATYPLITVTVNVANNLLIGSPVGNGVTFQSGDILLSMQDGSVQWRRSDWTLVKIITGVSDGPAKGMAFDASGNLFLTHFFGTGLSGNSVVKFDRNGNLIGLFGSSYDCNPSAIVFDNAGNAYIGHADCSGDIFKLDSQGNRLARYDVAVENRGSSHVLLGPDQCTMYYTSQGRNVKRFNVCTNTQMSDFNSTPLPEGIDGAHQLALLPGGGLLVADFSMIARLDASGNLVRTYNAPADTHCWLGVALDLDGASFWATNWCASSATRFDMATGNVIESHVAAGPGFMIKQIIVAPGGPSTVVINTAAVSGGGEVNISNNSASDSTTIMTQAQSPILSISSTAYCVGAPWSLGVTNARPDASVRLMGTTNGQSWVIAPWATTDAIGSINLGGTFAEGTQGSYTLRVDDGKISNTIYFVISNCRP